MVHQIIKNVSHSVICLLVFITSCPFSVYAQSEEELLSTILKEEPQFAENTFYGTRVVNSHSIENLEAKTLDFRINHRFGTIEQGAYDFFGLDQAAMRLGFDYGITDNIQIGVGRSTYEKTYDGFVKYRFLRQQNNERSIPVGMALVSGIAIASVKWDDPTRENFFTSRISYHHQLIIARKFSDGFSAQLMPSVVHRNLIDSSKYNHDVYSIGAAIKQKIASAVTVNVEYFYLLENQIQSDRRSSLSIGIDISTGSHTFQMHFTNATGTFEKAFMTETTNRWDKGQIHFGFNLVRKFHFDKSW